MDFGNTRGSSARKGKTYGDTLKSVNGAHGEPVFGRPSKPREQEPAFSDLMQWQPQTVERADFKKMKKDLLPFEDPQMEFYRSKIQKAENPWVSEARDNYRNFKDPEKDIKTRRFNLLSGEYSPPLPKNSSGGVAGGVAGGVNGADMQHHSMRARKVENPTAAGNEYGNSLLMGSQGQMMNQQQSPQQQYAQQSPQYQQQAPNQAQYMIGQQQPSMMNSPHSMLSPSQVQYPGGEMTSSLQLHPIDSVHGQNPQFQGDEVREDEFIDYEGEEIDPEQAKLDHQHMKDFLRTSRWKADTYTQKVLARPAFMNYGYKNVNPTVGGFLYGQYLHSHNVNPQRGMQPEYRQVYKNAQMHGDRVPPHQAPQIPRPKPPTINEEKVKENEMTRNPLEAEKLSPEKDKKSNTMKSSMRASSAGRKPNNNTNSANMQGSVAKQQSPMNIQAQYQPQPQQQQQMVQSQKQLASPKITITPADLDKKKAQNMNSADQERLMAKIAKDSGYQGNNNNYLSPHDMNKTVKSGNKAGSPQVGFVDQLSETKKGGPLRKDSGYESNYGGASSIGKYPGYDDDFLEIGSGF